MRVGVHSSDVMHTDDTGSIHGKMYFYPSWAGLFFLLSLRIGYVKTRPKRQCQFYHFYNLTVVILPVKMKLTVFKSYIKQLCQKLI